MVRINVSQEIPGSSPRELLFTVMKLHMILPAPTRYLFVIGFLFAMFSRAQEQRFITSDSVDLFIKVKGKGIPCLYVHGGPGSGSYWMEKFSGDILEERFQMIYLDLRGVGRSGSPATGDYGMDRMLRDFEEIRQHLGIGQWLVMGHSFSGTLLSGYALAYPEALRGLMMFNCTLNISESMEESWIPKAVDLLEIQDTAFYESDTIPTRDKLGRLFPMLNERDLGWKLGFKSKEQEERMNATFEEIPDWNGDFSGVGLFHPDYQKNFKARTAGITLPVLFFYGSKDWIVGPDHYKGVEFPNMLLYRADVRHVPFMDDKEEVARAIDRFLKRYPLK